MSDRQNEAELYQMMIKHGLRVKQATQERIAVLSRDCDQVAKWKEVAAKDEDLVNPHKLEEALRRISDREYDLGKDIERMARDQWLDRVIVNQNALAVAQFKVLRHIAELLEGKTDESVE